MSLSLADGVHLLSSHHLLDEVITPERWSLNADGIDNADVPFTHITYDTRTVCEGTLLVCKGRFRPEFLDGLKERGAHATFFLIGEQIVGNEDLVRRMKDEGHQVGGHSYTHIRLDSADAAALAEIQKTDETLRAILGDGDYWLRPPWGFASDALKSAVSVPLIYWTLDTMDWSVRNRDLVAHHIIENAKSGDIVLLHDPYDTSVEAALQTIDVLSEQGYEFVTLEELFSNAGVTPQAGHFYLRADEEVPW